MCCVIKDNYAKMAEWSNAPVSKTGAVNLAVVGSNPTLSATIIQSFLHKVKRTHNL